MNIPNAKSKRIFLSDKFFSDPNFHLFILLLFAFILYFSKLGGNGLWGDDSFYAQKAKEILSTGSWFTMHFDGNPNFDNPPFFIWLLAGSFSLFGVNDFGALFPSALFGVLSVGLMYTMTKRLYDSWTAFIAVTVLATTLPFMRYARHAMMDVTLTFFVNW